MQNDKTIKSDTPPIKLSTERQRMVDIGYLPLKQALYIERIVQEAELKRVFNPKTYEAALKRIPIMRQHVSFLNFDYTGNQDLITSIAKLLVAIDDVKFQLDCHFKK